jgi:hypothetical protein
LLTFPSFKPQHKGTPAVSAHRLIEGCDLCVVLILFAHLLLSAACRTDVGCCSEDYHKHQDVFRLPEDLKVGKCWWTLHYTGIPDRRQPQFGGPGDDFRDVFLVGTYEMTCEMEEESEKCGEPLCDDLVLHGWGRLYLDINAAIKGKPTVTGCDISDRRTAWFQRPAAPAQTPAVKPAEPAQEPALQPDVPVQKPARKPATPVQKPAEPVQKPIDPAVKPAEPTQRPAEPAVKPAEPAQKPAEPTQRPAQQPGVPAQKPAEPAQRPLRQLVGNTNPAKIASADYYYHDEHEAEYFLGVLLTLLLNWVRATRDRPFRSQTSLIGHVVLHLRLGFLLGA